MYKSKKSKTIYNYKLSLYIHNILTTYKYLNILIHFNLQI